MGRTIEKPRASAGEACRDYGDRIQLADSSDIEYLSAFENGMMKSTSDISGLDEYVIKSFNAHLPVKVSEDNYRSINVHLKTGYHNCACHKIAALCFFQWNRGYKQVPLIGEVFGSIPVKYLLLGEVEEVQFQGE